MESDMARTAVGYFQDRLAVDRAYDDLLREGFSKEDVSILGRGAEGKTGPVDDAHEGHHVTAGEGAAAGGIFGLLLGAAAMLIPGIGPIVAIGPITAALTGAITGGVTGAVVGGVAGALIHSGVPEEDARYYEDRIKTGGYLLTVHTDDAGYARARATLQRSGAELRSEDGQPAEVASTAGTREIKDGGQRMELREEELRANKQSVEAGAVHVRKDVVTERETIDVPVKHEEVVVERHAVNRPASGPIGTGTTEEVRVPVREEQVHIEKRPVAVEEVTVGKKVVEETEHVSETVRREVPQVTSSGDVRRGDEPRRP
jgi:uncharacterized protein (TIGR02271 family)